MRAEWPATRCILCLEEGALCEEHLIPRALGGKFSCNFLCRACNSRFGSKAEASAKYDPSILLAARTLHGDIPKLSQRLIESHPHFSTGEGPRTSGYMQDGAYRVSPQELEDGSLILPTHEARKAITTMLKRTGFGETPIKRTIDTFEKLPENRRTQIAPGLEVVKWSVEGIEFDLSQSKLIDPLLPSKIAFEFLALCTGEPICAHNPPLSELRGILTRAIGWDDRILHVERLHAGAARPFHGICNEENSQHAQIQVRLFGCLAYRVRFPRLHIAGPRYAYTHSLATGHEDVRIIDSYPRFN